MGVIFDLDQTLIDSSSLESLRKQRRWPEIYGLISSINQYEGIDALIKLLNQQGKKVAIVTKSPRPYCEKIINHFGWKVDVTVCYHDSRNQKPLPDPMQLAIEKMGVDISSIISIGDHQDDIISSKSAGLRTVGALWGCVNRESLLSAAPDFTFETIDELTSFFMHDN